MFPVMRFRVRDKSMEPSFRDGDYVVVVPYVSGAPSAGDVIVLRHPRTGLLILKRIAAVKDNEYYVKGDNEKASEDSRAFGPVKKDSVAGRVLFCVKQ